MYDLPSGEAKTSNEQPKPAGMTNGPGIGFGIRIGGVAAGAGAMGTVSTVDVRVSTSKTSITCFEWASVELETAATATTIDMTQTESLDISILTPPKRLKGAHRTNGRPSDVLGV